MSKMTPSSKSPVRIPQRPPSTKWSQSAKSCHIFIKLSGYLPYHLSTWSRISKMTPSSKSPVRNHQHPPNPLVIKTNFKPIFSWAKLVEKVITKIKLWNNSSKVLVFILVHKTLNFYCLLLLVVNSSHIGYDY